MSLGSLENVDETAPPIVPETFSSRFFADLKADKFQQKLPFTRIMDILVTNLTGNVNNSDNDPLYL
jgi:hypothetical protein